MSGRLVTAFALALLLPVPLVWARDVEEKAQPKTPEKNFSTIHDDNDWVTQAFASATSGAAEGDWATAVRALQPVIDQVSSRESPDDAAPYVQAVTGTAVFEGAAIVARHRIQAWGAPALSAYAREFGGTAASRLQRAATLRDKDLLGEVAARFLGLEAGRQAAILLCDLAEESGDVDRALSWLEALEDLEAVSTESSEDLAPWRNARITRQARLLAKDAASQPLLAAALTKANVAVDGGIDVVPPALLAPERTPSSWPTTGGNNARAAVAPALGGALRLRWFRGPDDFEHLADTVNPRRRHHDRPSLWLPPRAVASEKHLFVSDGDRLHIYDLATGAPVLDDPARGQLGRGGGGVVGIDTAEDRRIQFGLLEGHALTIHPVTRFPWTPPGARDPIDLGAGWLVLAAVPDGGPWEWGTSRSTRHIRRDDHLEAFHFDGKALTSLWRCGGSSAPSGRGGLQTDTRLYGAPLVYRGRIWIGGVRAAKATKDRWESWLFSFDPETGRVITRTHIGTGTPMRTGRMDEVIPTSPAADRGRIVIGTALGIIASVSAHDGRIAWVYRYDRAVETERGRRNRDRRDEGLRTTSFSNEPPILALDRCYITPTDSHKILVLFSRPRTAARRLEAHGEDRLLIRSRATVEHIAGVVPAAAGSALVYICQGESGTPPGPLVAVRDARLHDPLWPTQDRESKALWEGISPTGFGAQPFGRAMVTAGEVFVPQEHGIAVFELTDKDRNESHFLTLLDTGEIPAALKAARSSKPYGNLIPIPGRGLVSVNATSIAFWAVK